MKNGFPGNAFVNPFHTALSCSSGMFFFPPCHCVETDGLYLCLSGVGEGKSEKEVVENYEGARFQNGF